MLRGLVHRGHAVVPAAQGGGGTSGYRQLGRAVHNIGSRELADAVMIYDLCNGLGDNVEHERGGNAEELRVLQSRRVRLQEGRETVRQLGEGAGEKADLREALAGDGGDGAVNQAVELLAGGEGQLHLAAVRSGSHATLAAPEKQCGLRASLDGKSHRDSPAPDQLRGFLVQVTQIRDSPQDGEQVDVRQGRWIFHGNPSVLAPFRRQIQYAKYSRVPHRAQENSDRAASTISKKSTLSMYCLIWKSIMVPRCRKGSKANSCWPGAAQLHETGSRYLPGNVHRKPPCRSASERMALLFQPGQINIFI